MTDVLIPEAPIVEFSEKMQCIFSEKRYIVLHGGRGAGRSWGIAIFLLMQARERKVTILCARELQKSIGESVHKVLETQIKRLGIEDEFDIQRDYIYGPNGSEFSFIGVKNDPKKVKSYEDIDYCWVEEANNVSKTSWEVLTPTVRKKGSKIIISFNPELDDDYTYKTFVTQALREAKPIYCLDPDSISYNQILWYETADSVICYMTYKDNPWFYSDTELPADMEKDRRNDEDKYLNVWEGHTRQHLEGAVYAKELRRVALENRICTVGWYRETPVDTYWDLGHSDRTCIWFVQRVAMQFRVLDFLSGSLQELSWYIKELQRKEYVYGCHWLPHDAKAKRLGMRHTIQEQMMSAFPSRVRIVPIANLADGINAVREIFPQCYFDEENTSEGVQGLRHYRYKISNGQLGSKPIHDSASNDADAFRTFAMAQREPRPSDADFVIRKLQPKLRDALDGALSSLGWMS